VELPQPKQRRGHGACSLNLLPQKEQYESFVIMGSPFLSEIESGGPKQEKAYLLKKKPVSLSPLS
jgi:hypothetical protein